MFFRFLQNDKDWIISHADLQITQIFKLNHLRNLINLRETKFTHP